VIRAPFTGRDHGEAGIRRRGGVAVRRVARREAAPAARSRRSSSSRRCTSAPTSTRRTCRSLSKEQPAEITLDAVPTRRTTGVCARSCPPADRQKATVRVKVAFLDADDRVLPDPVGRA
jgi:hypothetical protein